MVSERATATTPFEAMAVLERAGELEDVVHLEVGEPDFRPPAAAIEAAVASLRADGHDYTSSRGKPELRAAISAYYDRQYGVDVPPDRLVVTPGTSPGLLITMLSLVDPGDEVLLTDPYYACYPNFVRQADGRIRTVPVTPRTGFVPTPSAVADAIDPGVAAVLLNSPANPTGAVLDGDTLAAVAERAARADARVVSDEVYHGLSYDGRAPSILEYTDEAFVVDGFSKRFSMTGWRLGWVVCPPGYTEVVNRLAQNLVICAPNFVQDAGVAALEVADEYVPTMRDTYRERREVLVDAVEDLGLSMGYTPGGAYYLLIDVGHLGDPFAVADELLTRCGVAATPGPDFGPNAADCLRLSYATDVAQLEEAIDRMGALVEAAPRS